MKKTNTTSRTRGIAGVVAVIAVGVLAITASVFLILRTKEPVSPVPEVVVQESAVPESRSEDVPVAVSVQVLFGEFLQKGSGVYYRTYTPPTSHPAVSDSTAFVTGGTNAAAPQDVGQNTSNDLGEYQIIPGADAATLSEIRSVSLPTPKSDTNAQVTYYRDDDQVFVQVDTLDTIGGTTTQVQVVTADPASFQILDDTYAKDDTNVYLVSWVCQGEDCTLVLDIVFGADPETFHTFQETQVPQSDGTGSVTADAQDATHVFDNGVIVDTVITPGSQDVDTTPKLISP